MLQLDTSILDFRNNKLKSIGIGELVLTIDNKLYVRISKENSKNDFLRIPTTINNFEPKDSNSLDWFEDNSAEIKLSQKKWNSLTLENDGLYTSLVDISYNKIPILNSIIVNKAFKTERLIKLKQSGKYILEIPVRSYEIINNGEDTIVNIELKISVDNVQVYTRTQTNCVILKNDFNTFIGLSDFINLDDNKEIKVEFIVNTNEDFDGKVFINDFYLNLIEQ